MSISLKDAVYNLSIFAPFDAGNLTASVEDEEALLYVVRSYGVAIADAVLFYDHKGVYPSAYGYSPTTSKHVNLVKRAWGLMK